MITAVRPAESRVRWTICALLFFATTINYVDRQVLSMLAKTLETSIGWNNIEYGNITTAFTTAYAISMLGAGRLLDKFGTRIGFGIAVAVWSVAAMAHAAATTAFTFGLARVFLGLGEAANFPACIKTVAEWFPKKERASATGLFNAGANVGAIIAPLTVPWLASKFGWQAAFIATGAIGFVWLAAWLAMYSRPQEHSRVSKTELALIESDPADKVGHYHWMRLLPKKETWAFAMGKFMTDPVWWFYLFWLPKYLQETFGLTLSQIVVPTLVVYNASSVGSVAGGWLSSSLIQRGWSTNSARKTAMLTCALAVVPVMYAPYARNMWLVVGLVGLATAAHQGWSANLFTTPSDMFPRAAVGSVVGIGGAMGAAGSALMQQLAGHIIQWTGSYFLLFMISGSAYLVALAIIQLLSPKLAQAELD
ncbi:MAG TPA: MFS transporter [Candidatus Acidoferrales bacterium]|nr:MFS transporter [Candidatus Acidoferrales bacterium]